MGFTTSFLIVVFGYLAFGISAVIWISKKKKAGKKISLRAKIIIAVVFLSGPNILISMIELSPVQETSVSEARTYYVKAKSANVRECPSTSCKVIDSLSQNTPLTFPGGLFDKYPDWVEVTFQNGEIGYVSKTTLSENTVPESQLTPTDDSSSTGGIIIGPWSNLQMTLGDSYEFPFCEPPSAISGATCGALADTTTDPKGGTPPYSFIKKSGFLPPGITLELNGTLKGAPTQEGTYNFRLCAKDLYGGEGCQNLAVVVKKDDEVFVTPPRKSNAIAPKVSIDSLTCTYMGADNQPEPDTMHYFDIKLSGTASGPVPSVLRVYYRTVMDGVYQSPYGDNYLHAAWTGFPESNLAERARNSESDPATINWEAGGWKYMGQRSGNNTIPAQILWYAYVESGGVINRAEKVVVCSP